MNRPVQSAQSASGWLLFWCLAALGFWFVWDALLRHTLLSGDTATLALLTLPSLWLLAAARNWWRQQEHDPRDTTRGASLHLDQRHARGWLMFCGALLLALLLPLSILLGRSIEARPWREGLVALPQLWQAVRG